MKFNNTLSTCIQADIDNNIVPLLLGEPGIGKSSWVEDLAAKMHTKCFTLACNQLADKADLTGARLVPVVDADGTVTTYKQVFYPHAVISEAIDYARANPRETPILFLDEINRSTPDITTECLSLPTMRAIGSSTLPDNLRIMLAGNDKGNISSLDEASISRFALYRVTPDTTTFLTLIDDLHPTIKAVLSKNPDAIFGRKLVDGATDDDDSDDDDSVAIDDIIGDDTSMDQITTPRTVKALSDWLNSIDADQLRNLFAETHVVNGDEISVLQDIIEGHVGHTTFSVLLIAELSNTIMTIAASPTVSVAKPAIYDELKAATTRTQLDASIADLTDNEKSGCVVYALYEKEDNAPILQALASSLALVANDDMTCLMKLKTANKLDTQNIRAFLDTHTQLAERLSVILEA